MFIYSNTTIFIQTYINTFILLNRNINKLIYIYTTIGIYKKHQKKNHDRKTNIEQKQRKREVSKSQIAIKQTFIQNINI